MGRSSAQVERLQLRWNRPSLRQTEQSLGARGAILREVRISLSILFNATITIIES